MSQVYQYEIEVRIRNKTTGAERLVTRTEWAYRIEDLLYQTALNMSKEIGSDEMIARADHIGPPMHLIEAAALDMTRLIEEAMKRIQSMKK